MLLFLSLTVAAALLGGLYPALASAAFGSLLLNYYFTPPLHRLTIADPKNIVAIVVFFAVAVSVASVVDLAARRTHQAARLRAESEILSFLAGSVLRGETSLEALLERVRETFGMESVALLERESDVDPWTCAGERGPTAVCRPRRTADVDMPVGDHMALALSGRVLPAEDRRVLAAFAAQAAVVLDRQRLKHEADQAKVLAEGNRIRTALLAAVSHDLRTPLAGIKASVSSLRSDDVEWSEEDQAELLAAIEEGADRLDHLVGNLLDMSRLQTGTVAPLIREIDLDEVVPIAVGGIPDPESAVVLDVPETLPMVAIGQGAPGAGRRQRRRERRQVQPRRRARPGLGQRPRRPCGGPGGGPRSGRPGRGQGPHLRSLPALRRRPPRQRSRPRPRGRPRLHRGHGRHPPGRGHPRRRPHHGPQPPGRDGPPTGHFRPFGDGRSVERQAVTDDDCSPGVSSGNSQVGSRTSRPRAPARSRSGREEPEQQTARPAGVAHPLEGVGEHLQDQAVRGEAVGEPVSSAARPGPRSFSAAEVLAIPATGFPPAAAMGPGALRRRAPSQQSVSDCLEPVGQ